MKDRNMFFFYSMNVQPLNNHQAAKATQSAPSSTVLDDSWGQMPTGWYVITHRDGEGRLEGGWAENL